MRRPCALATSPGLPVPNSGRARTGFSVGKRTQQLAEADGKGAERFLFDWLPHDGSPYLAETKNGNGGFPLPLLSLERVTGLAPSLRESAPLPRKLGRAFA